jgi:uncharacterized membrane protein YeiB
VPTHWSFIWLAVPQWISTVHLKKDSPVVEIAYLRSLKIAMRLATPKTRISVIDALRGFALFGIIIAHYCDQYYAGMLPPGHENFNVKNTADAILGLLHNIFVFGKFFTIFSFLFGVSFGIQIANAQEKNQAFAGRFVWRLLLLLAIGFADHIFYRGDILMIYALLGFPCCFLAGRAIKHYYG